MTDAAVAADLPQQSDPPPVPAEVAVVGRRTVPELQRNAPEPLHTQISGQLRDLILTRAWPPHHRVLPEHQLAAQLGVARGTARKAVRALVDEGLLVQVQGRGTFVTARGFGQAVEHDTLSLAEAMSSHGLQPDTQLLARSTVTPSQRMIELLELPADDPPRLVRLERLRTTQESPVAYFVNYVREDVCPHLDDRELAGTSLYELIERSVGRRVAAGRRSFEARGADQDMAERLEVPVGTPLQYFEQVTYLAGGQTVELSEVWVRSDRVRLTSLVTRPLGAAGEPAT